MRAILAVLLLLSTALTACADPRPPTKAQWHSDVAWFGRELAKRHANAFPRISREQFAAAIAELDARVDTASDNEITVGLMRIAAMVGDGHTYVHTPKDFRRYPIGVYRFGDELRITRAAADAKPLLGGRIIRIDDTPVAAAIEKLSTVLAQGESEWYIRGTVPSLVASAEVLHGAGVAKSAERATFTVVTDDGREVTRELRAAPANPNAQLLTTSDVVPLYRRNPDKGFFFEYLEPQKTVYVMFRRYDDLRARAKELWSFVDQHAVDKLVFDLRQNGGGDYTDGRKYLINELKRRPKLTAPGHLFVIVGNRTFSAAMNNAVDFRTMLRATLVGEPIGERPNSYQENDEMTLPASRLVVSYSTRFYKFLPDDAPPIVMPDETIAPTWSEYAAGRDPVLEWILAREVNPRPKRRGQRSHHEHSRRAPLVGARGAMAPLTPRLRSGLVR